MVYTHKDEDPIFGLDFEVRNYKEASIAYIHVHSREIPCLENDLSRSVASFHFEDRFVAFTPYRLAGGQTLRFNKEDSSKILKILQDQESIEIKLNGFESKIESMSFFKPA